MRVILLSQGSQGLMALRNLFENNFSPEEIIIRICEGVENGPLTSFLDYMGMEYSIVGSNSELSLSLAEFNLEDYVLASISWKYKVSMELVNSVRFAINLHPGLLPQYRGCFSTPWSIINGERECGYTYHFMEKEFDTGRILLKKSFDIGADDTAFNLNYKLMNHALTNLSDVLRLALKSEGIEQGGQGQYYPNSLPYSGRIPRSASPELADRIRRASYFPPFPEATRDDQ